MGFETRTCVATPPPAEHMAGSSINMNIHIYMIHQGMKKLSKRYEKGIHFWHVTKVWPWSWKYWPGSCAWHIDSWCLYFCRVFVSKLWRNDKVMKQTRFMTFIHRKHIKMSSGGEDIDIHRFPRSSSVKQVFGFHYWININSFFLFIVETHYQRDATLTYLPEQAK